MTLTSPFGGSRLSVDRQSNTIVLERRLSATRRDVFEAWTDPHQVAMWWDPDGKELSSCEIDLREGGRFTFVPRGHPDMPFSGTYKQITPYDRLVFEALGALGTVNLTEDDGTTLMRVEIKCHSTAHLDQFLQMGVGENTARTLDNLDSHVATKSR